MVPFSGTELLLAAATFCLVLWAVRAGRPRVPRGQQSPPGPWGWPLLGHALSLGRAPHETLARLSQRYGPVLQVRLGLTPVLVLGGPHAIRQALVRQADAFKGRPALHTFSLVADGQSLTFSPDSGPVWAARRRLAQSALRGFSGAADPGAACSRLETHVAREAEALAARFLALTEGPGRFDPYELLAEAAAGVVGAVCFGARFPRGSPEMLALVRGSHDFVETAGSGHPADFLPILRLLPSPSLRRFEAFNRRFLGFLQRTAQEHKRQFNKDCVQDLVGALLKHSMETSGRLVPQAQIVNLVNDIFGAGFDTVTTALSWSLLYLVTHPDVQEKIHRELDAVVGRARRPRLSDRPQLPYLEAFILETFRHSSFVPFTIPHSTTRDTTLNGFYIPKGTCVFVNQWQVNHDPELWGDPGAFRPERFLGSEGRVDRALAEQVLLFGLGRRRCVGEGLARAELFLFLALLLHRLGLRVAAGARVDARPVYGLTMKLARCPYYQAWPRA
ncbi:cytochrome P450 1A2 isoform X2 [Erinaceus europaeus]|nr:cytochrome P450 1A2 isoform X2 [Erinaceus europaeus]